MSEQPVFVVGIDLGTTNCAVAYAPVEADPEDAPVRDFGIVQLVREGHVEERPTLPSAVLLSRPGELPHGALDLPWAQGQDWAAGTFARKRGAEVPTRLVHSAKSWLCYGAERRDPILPPGDHDGPRISPVEALARLLRHLRDAWNWKMARDDARRRLEQQHIVLTVPASFDPVARELTVEAARLAGLGDVILLEEPQAAVYAWVAARGRRWRDEVHVGDVLLACDVGGGTSDFSLIAVRDEGGALALERVAVGEHILLGGDNMDLALAHVVQRRLAQRGARLDAWQSRALWQACREAKEALLADSSRDSMPITVLGRGSKLIGGSLKTELTRADVAGVVDAFFPVVALSERPRRRAAAGLRQVGLPYAADAAVTRHLAAFVSRHREAAGGLPTAVLFNGGVFQAEVTRGRVLETTASWAREVDAPPPRALAHAHLDLAVARGAAYYGLARQGRGVRIRGGTARAYYIGVAAPLPAVPGLEPPVDAVCVAPFGMEEGSEAELPGQEFHLVVGEPVHFRFFSSTSRRTDRPGDVVGHDRLGELDELAPVEVELPAGADAGAGERYVPVRLESRYTPIGTLELWCVARDGRRWRLEYDVRAVEQSAPEGA